MPGTLTKVVAIAVLAAAVGGALWYLRLDAGAEQATLSAAAREDSAPTAVEVAEVEVGPVLDAVTVTGSLRSDEDAIISAEIAGRISGIHFEEGQPVEPGDLLFTLDDAIYRAELATAEANLARTRLDKTRITAPFGGVVGLRQVSVGEYVTPGQDLVNLEDIDPIKVDFPVPERYLSAVAVGQGIEVIVEAWPDRTFEGEVYAIDPQINAAGRSIAIRATIDNQERLLRPGLFAAVRLIIQQREEALLVPEQAVFAQGERQYVYVVNDGTARLTEVRLGGRRVGQVEITSGLEAGDVVVTAGHMKLRDGGRVRRIDAGGPADDQGEVS